MNAHDTPSGTRMMWHASVNAICTRAHGTGFTATRPWSAGRMDIQARPVVGRCSIGRVSRVRRDHSCSFSTSRPCIVSAQITAIATAMIEIAQIGYYGNQANPAIALTTADDHADDPRPHGAGEHPEAGEHDDDPDDQVDPSPGRPVELEDVLHAS